MTHQELLDLVETFVAEAALVGGPPLFWLFVHHGCSVSCVWSDALQQALHGGSTRITFKAQIVCLQCGHRLDGSDPVKLDRMHNGSEILAAVRDGLECR